MSVFLFTKGFSFVVQIGLVPAADRMEPVGTVVDRMEPVVGIVAEPVVGTEAEQTVGIVAEHTVGTEAEHTVADRTHRMEHIFFGAVAQSLP